LRGWPKGYSRQGNGVIKRTTPLQNEHNMSFGTLLHCKEEYTAKMSGNLGMTTGHNGYYHSSGRDNYPVTNNNKDSNDDEEKQQQEWSNKQ